MASKRNKKRGMSRAFAEEINEPARRTTGEMLEEAAALRKEAAKLREEAETIQEEARALVEEKVEENNSLQTQLSHWINQYQLTQDDAFKSVKLLPLDQLILDSATQPRTALDMELIEQYAQEMIPKKEGRETIAIVDTQGKAWPPVVVVSDRQNFWVVDGFHRVMAAKKAGLTHFQYKIIMGNFRSAVQFSLGVNADHGKRRTNADKRRAVERALRDEEWARSSNAVLAQWCKVSKRYVGQVRKQLEDAGEIEVQNERIGSDGQVIQAQKFANFGAQGGTTRAQVAAAEQDETPSLELPENIPGVHKRAKPQNKRGERFTPPASSKSTPTSITSSTAPAQEITQDSPALDVDASEQPIRIVLDLQKNDWYRLAHESKADILITRFPRDWNTWAFDHMSRSPYQWRYAIYCEEMKKVLCVWSQTLFVGIPEHAASLDDIKSHFVLDQSAESGQTTD